MWCLGTCFSGHCGDALIDIVILEVFFNLNDSMILFRNMAQWAQWERLTVGFDDLGGFFQTSRSN